MPRRVYTYPPEMHWSTLNLISRRLGVALHAAGMLVFLVECLPQQAPRRTRGAESLESGHAGVGHHFAAAHYNFLHLPTVNGREALWDAAPNQPIVTGIRDDIPEMLVTNSLDSEPQYKEECLTPSIWPFLTLDRSFDCIHLVNFQPLGNRLRRHSRGDHSDWLACGREENRRLLRYAAPRLEQPWNL